MKRGQKTGAEQVVLKLRQIEVQTAQGKILALACKEAEISEQNYYRWRNEYRSERCDSDLPTAYDALRSFDGSSDGLNAYRDRLPSAPQRSSQAPTISTTVIVTMSPKAKAL
jgi:putative transposase